MIRRVLGRLARHDLAAPIALALCSRAMVVLLLVGLQAVATGLRDALSVFAAWDGWVVLGTVLARSRHRRPLLFASVLVMALQTFIVVAGRAVP